MLVKRVFDKSLPFISGATEPEYVVTADDINKLIALEHTTIDDEGHEVQIWNNGFYE